MIEAITVADEDQRRRNDADVIPASGETRGDPALNSALRRRDVRADCTPALHDGQDGFYHRSKLHDDGVIAGPSANSAVEGTSAVTKEEASATEESAVTAGDPEECSEKVLRDEQPVTEDRAKFGVIRSSFVGEANSAMSALNTRGAGINHLVVANSALEDPAIESDSEAVPACRITDHYVIGEHGRVEVCPAIASATVSLASADLNAESDSDVATACRQDVIQPGDELAHAIVSSTVAANSADQRSDATKDYASREVLLLEGTKPIDDLATVDSALETLDDENSSDMARQHNVDAIYLGDKSEHVEARLAVVVASADMGPHVEDTYSLSKVSLLRGIGLISG
ncbi:hypothetical protein PInf_013729 [Phytophthora infestans]|nr:hypothetical protein PInf_013729 [Phytophthora infestans]